MGKKKPGPKPRQSRWIMRVAAPAHPVGIILRLSGEAPALPGCLVCHSWQSPPDPLKTDHPWSLSSSLPGYITPPNRTVPGGLTAFLAASFVIQMTIPGRHLHIRCITKLVFPLPLQLLPSYSVNGSAVVYLLLLNTKLVFTWCTALHGIMCSRSNFSYARMLLHAIFK